MVRQRVRTESRKDLDLLVRITFAGVEYGCGEQDCRTAIHDYACAFAPVSFRKFDALRFYWSKRLPATPHHEMRVKEEAAFDITQEVFSVRDDSFNMSSLQAGLVFV